jgi:hypothetical protein
VILDPFMARDHDITYSSLEHKRLLCVDNGKTGFWSSHRTRVIGVVSCLCHLVFI